MLQEFTLTDDQQKAFDEITEWYFDSEDRYKTLSGYAGTGKTVLIDYIVNYFKKKRVYMCVTATTNKAVKVLRQKVDYYPEEFKTIHKLCNIKPKRRGRKEVFEPVMFDKMDINNYQLVIIDEASMISKKLLGIIQSQADEYVKILFVGDPAQLQPVNETISECFEYNPSMLTKIVRHGDTIAHKSKLFRSTPQYIPFEQAIEEPTISWTNVDFLKEVAKEFREDPDKYRVLAWTNAQVKKWNFKMRVFDYGYIPTHPFNVGDIVFANELCEDPASKRVLMNNSEEAVVTDIEEMTDSLGLEYYMLLLKRDSGESYVNVIKEEFEPKLRDFLNEEAKEKNWKSFWYTKKYFHNVTHCYAMTTHKSQGSSFGNVILDIKDMNKNRDVEERNQLAYVGLTRAIDRVYLLR